MFLTSSRLRAKRSSIALFVALSMFSFATTLGAHPADAATRLVRVDNLVGVGDSFASGAGNSPYEPGTDVEGGCFRSTTAFPLIVGKQLKVKAKSVACSGAEARNIYDPFRDQAPQKNAVRNATIIVGSIGGNDYQHVVNPDYKDNEGYGNPATFTKIKPQIIKAYKELKTSAPYAKIYIVGYPLIFPKEFSLRCKESFLRWVDPALISNLNNTIKLAAAEAGVNYVDISNAFEGHEICTADPYAYGRTSEGKGSFHPNSKGHQLIGEIIANQIKFGAVQAEPTTVQQNDSSWWTRVKCWVKNKWSSLKR